MLLRSLGGLSLEGSDFTRPKPLLLLAYLGLEGRRDRGFLADLFWPEAKDPRKSLRVALSQLARGVSGAIGRDRGHAWAEVGTDAARFLAALERDEPQRGLDLYRGPFCDGVRLRTAGVELEAWLYGSREFLAGRARAARLRLAEHAAVEGDLIRAGEHADAAWSLRGAAPLAPDGLRRLHTLLLAAGSPHASAVEREAEGFGLELEPSREAACDAFRATSEAPTPTALPTPGTGFVGRAPERSEIATLLTDPGCRLLTLVGTAGVGKTRLALHVAREVTRTGEFGGRVRFAALESLRGPGRLPAALADALGLDPGGEPDPMARVARAIGESEILLLLDSFEGLPGSAERLPGLLDACPHLTLLVTSRERLHLAVERIFPLTGLAVPPPSAEPLEAETAKRYDAVELFVQRARRARPGFVLDDASLPAVVRICELVEGLPLALVLAATWLRALPCADVAREIERNLAFLAAPTRDVPDRHRSLEAAFARSWELLAAEERDALRQLAVFRGGFRREAAAEVGGTTIPLLASLVDKSLLRLDRTGRYDRHPLLHRFARNKLSEQPELRAEARARHCAHYLDRLERWHRWLRDGRQRQALRALQPELENIRAAWEWALETKRLDDLRSMTEPLTIFFDTRGRAHEGEALFAAAIETLVPNGTSAEKPENSERAEPARPRRASLGALRAARGWLLYRLGRYRQASHEARRGLALVESGTDPASAARALNTLGGAALRTGEPSRARQRWGEALELARTSGEERDVTLHRGNLAIVDLLTGAYPSAERRLRSVLAAHRERGDRFRTVRPLNTLGIVHLYSGELEAARARFEEGLELARAMEVREMVPYFLGNLADVAYEAGELSRARQFGQRALAALPEGGDRSLEAANLVTLGRIAVAAGDPDEAQRRLVAALRLAHRLEATPKVLAALSGLAAVRAARDEPARAARLLAFVRRHPATERPARRHAERLWSKLRPRLAAASIVEAGAWAEETSLADAVETVLATAGPRSRV